MLCQESLDGGSSHLLTINPTLLLGQYSLLLGRGKVRQSQGFVRRHLAIGMRITQANATVSLDVLELARFACLGGGGGL